MIHPNDFPNSLSLAYIERLHDNFLHDSTNVPVEWRRYFQAVGEGNGADLRREGHSLMPRDWFYPRAGEPCHHRDTTLHEQFGIAALQHRIDQLIRAYRVRGHMIARLDPLGMPRPRPPELELEYYRFTADDLDRPFSAITVAGGNVRTLREIYERLQNTYCRFIGVQFMHIDELSIRDWLCGRSPARINSAF